MNKAWDQSRFNAALDSMMGKFKYGKAAAFVNQVALDVSVRNVELTAPSDADTQRKNLSAFLRAQISTRVKLARRGKRAGHFIPAVARKRNLIRANLIANKIRGRAGLPGLYGDSMKRYTGKMTGRRTRGTGFLKSVWFPVVRGFNAVAKYKVSYTRLFHGVAQWPGSKGRGTATPAASGDKPTAILKVFEPVRTGQGNKVQAMQDSIFQQALNWKAGKLEREFWRETEKEFAAANKQMK